MSIELFFGDIVKDEATGVIGVITLDPQHGCPCCVWVPKGMTGVTIEGKIKLGSIYELINEPRTSL